MGNKSKIEWTDVTWNPVTGCTKVSPGCKNCYAERMFHRPYPGRAFTEVRTHEDRLNQPLHWRTPRRIFVNSMGDLFHAELPLDFVRKVWDTTVATPQHTYQILTKRPQRAREFAEWMAGEDDASIAEWPRNVWMGVSVEDQKTADERIPLLLKTPAAVHFVSYEPALGPVDLTRCIPCGYYCDESVGHVDHGPNGNLGHIDWVIAGGESGPHARPAHPDWFRSVRDQCHAAGVPFFFKQWGEWLPAGQDGAQIPGQPQELNSSDTPIRVGKKRAGRLLDGCEWNEMPNSVTGDRR